MGRSNNNKSRRRRKKAQQKQTSTTKRSITAEDDWNFELDAGPGCHIARTTDDDDDLAATPSSSSSSSCWVLEWERDVDPLDYQGDDQEEIPDLAIDPEDRTLTLCNIRNVHVVAYITVFELVLRGRNGQILQQGTSVDNEGRKQECTTLIVLCPPCTFCHLCYIDLPSNNNDSPLDNLRLESDVQEWNRHGDPSDTHPQTIGFPLQGGPFRCTQGEGGQLTHFFAGNLHAIDFACPTGTPLLAVADGVVVETKVDNRLTGIAVSNLFRWNSILIRLDTEGNTNDEGNKESVAEASTKSGPLFVEYVHIETASVRAGDRVQAGQIIGTSGSVGFSPEPHLHFAAYRTHEPTAATVRVFFHTARNREATFLPRAGQWYDENGTVVVDKAS